MNLYDHEEYDVKTFWGNLFAQFSQSRKSLGLILLASALLAAVAGGLYSPRYRATAIVEPGHLHELHDQVEVRPDTTVNLAAKVNLGCFSDEVAEGQKIPLSARILGREFYRIRSVELVANAGSPQKAQEALQHLVALLEKDRALGVDYGRSALKLQNRRNQLLIAKNNLRNAELEDDIAACQQTLRDMAIQEAALASRKRDLLAEGQTEQLLRDGLRENLALLIESSPREAPASWQERFPKQEWLSTAEDAMAALALAHSRMEEWRESLKHLEEEKKSLNEEQAYQQQRLESMKKGQSNIIQQKEKLAGVIEMNTAKLSTIEALKIIAAPAAQNQPAFPNRFQVFILTFLMGVVVTFLFALWGSLSGPARKSRSGNRPQTR